MKKMIELPCGIGDKLWCINDFKEVEEVECLGFIISTSALSVVFKEWRNEDEYNLPIESGLLFLSEEKAKQALQDIK